MRHQYQGGSRRLARVTVTTAVAALLGAILVGISGCAGRTGATVVPRVSTSKPAGPSASASRPAATTPEPNVVRAALSRSVPVRLEIPVIGVDSGLMDLGLKADGTMEVPPGGFPAGWYTGMPTPGELGPAVIVGHVDLSGPGVFYNLHNLKPGDTVTITRKDGSKPVFRVTRVDRFPKDRFPTDLVYGSVDHAALRLITCGGSFNRKTGHYDDNFVAFADLVRPA